MISACELGAERMAGVIEKYGVPLFRETIADLMDYSEARMRAEIAAIPDGTYSFEDYMEDDGIDARPYRIAVDMVVQGDEIIADFGRSDAQAKGAINATLGVTCSATYNAMLHLTDPSIPRNAGCYRPIRVLARPTTVVNVDFPAPEVGGNTETHVRICYTVIAAMSRCLPERAFATDAGTHGNFLFGGHDSENDEFYVCYDFMVAGWGGRPFADGNNTCNCINGNCRTVPVEVYESRYPWLVENLSLTEDSGGAGKYRGGLGSTKTLECTADEITISYMADRHRNAPGACSAAASGGRPRCSSRRRTRPSGWTCARATARSRPASSATSPSAGATGSASSRAAAAASAPWPNGRRSWWTRTCARASSQRPPPPSTTATPRGRRSSPQPGEASGFASGAYTGRGRQWATPSPAHATTPSTFAIDFGYGVHHMHFAVSYEFGPCPARRRESYPDKLSHWREGFSTPRQGDKYVFIQGSEAGLPSV